MQSARSATCSTRATAFASACSRSDVERTQTYGFAGAPPSYVGGLSAFEATIRVSAVVDGDRAFVEWFASFDATESRRDELRTFLADAFARWLGSLRRTLAREAAIREPVAAH
jgi:hypothetical protein